MPQKGRSLSIGFYETYEEASYPALKRALPHLDWIVPNWLSLQGPDMVLTPAVDRRVISLVRSRKPAATIIPMLQNIQKGNWNGDDLAQSACRCAATRRASRADSSAFLSAHRFPGLAIDFENVPESAHKESAGRFFPTCRRPSRRMAGSSSRPCRSTTTPGHTKITPTSSITRCSWPMTSMTTPKKPGSIAGQGWFEKTLAERMRVLDPAIDHHRHRQLRL